MKDNDSTPLVPNVLAAPRHASQLDSVSAAPADPRALRTDIQALRGLAVAVVVLYHARFGLLSSGYLGVDIFFVISGFLITRLVADAIARGTFTYAGFYFRRAKRLLPAAYVTLAVTVALAPFLLAGNELRDLRGQMIGAVTFTSNFVLWQQSGYFGGDAALKPLLHVWSLSIEEQYYFLLPVTLVLAPRRYWLRGVLAVIGVSIALTVARAGRDSSFYLLPTRAWELGLGSLGAVLAPSSRLTAIVRAGFWPALVGLLVLPAISIPVFHPGPQAFLVCLATLLVILRAHPILSSGPVVRVLAWLGDRSYSLYLVHWPLFAFLGNVILAERTETEYLPLRLALVVLSVGLAWALNRWVEEPARHAALQPNARVLGATLLSSLLLIGAGIALPMIDARDGRSTVRQSTHGLADGCEYAGRFTANAECRTGAAPTLLLWGDSYAMHLVPALRRPADSLAFEQATRSLCGPLRGLAYMQDNPAGRTSAEGCLRFTEDVLAYLDRTPSIRTVVLSSPFSQFLYPQLRVLRADPRDTTVVPGNVPGAVAAMKRTVDAVRSLGRRVVIVAPPPSVDFDLGRCAERVARRQPVLGVPADCGFPLEQYHRQSAEVLRFLDEVRRDASVEVISFDALLCPSGRCRTIVNDTIIYRDRGHFSTAGAAFAGRAIDLIGQINTRAR